RFPGHFAPALPRASVGGPGRAGQCRAAGSEPLSRNPCIVVNHPRVSHSETTAPGISATVVPAPNPVRDTSFKGCSMPHGRVHTRVSSLVVGLDSKLEEAIMGVIR